MTNRLLLSCMSVLAFSSAMLSTAVAQSSADPCGSAQMGVRSLQTIVDRDQAAIRSLGFSRRIDELNEWQRLDGKARAERMSAALDFLIASAKKTSSVIGSLNPPIANKAISTLRAAGVDTPPLNRAIRTLAGTSGKPSVAQDVNDFLGALSTAKKSAALAPMPVDRESKLKALSMVLGWFQTSPTLALLSSDLAFTASSISALGTGLIHQKVLDETEKLNVRDLVILQRLSGELTADVQKLRTAESRSARTCQAESAAGPSSAEAEGRRRNEEIIRRETLKGQQTAQSKDDIVGTWVVVQSRVVEQVGSFSGGISLAGTSLSFVRQDAVHVRSSALAPDWCKAAQLFSNVGPATYTAECNDRGSHVTETVAVSAGELHGTLVWDGRGGSGDYRLKVDFTARRK